MKRPTVRTSVDLPRALHRRLRQEAARKGCSARKLIIEALEKAIDKNPPVKPKKKGYRLDVTHGLFPRAGRVINPTYDEIYAEFP